MVPVVKVPGFVSPLDGCRVPGCRNPAEVAVEIVTGPTTPVPPRKPNPLTTIGPGTVPRTSNSPSVTNVVPENVLMPSRIRLAPPVVLIPPVPLMAICLPSGRHVQSRGENSMPGVLRRTSKGDTPRRTTTSPGWLGDPAPRIGGKVGDFLGDVLGVPGSPRGGIGHRQAWLQLRPLYQAPHPFARLDMMTVEERVFADSQASQGAFVEIDLRKAGVRYGYPVLGGEGIAI